MIKTPIFWTLLLCLMIPLVAHTECKEPYLPSFSERLPNSIMLTWKDNNINPLGFKVSFGLKGYSPETGTISNLITEKKYKIDGLNSGVTYDVYIKTFCSATEGSKWEGPYSFTSAITVPSPCPMNIGLRDNNCGQGDEIFYIYVGNDGILGQNVFLHNVDLIIKHSWPADLAFSLTSPSGKTAVLSSHNGTFTDNFGIIDNTCQQFTSFTDLACISIKESSPPYLDNIRPEEPLAIFHDGTSAKGLWKLTFCDDTAQDKGTLVYSNLGFENIVCESITNITLTNIGDQNATIHWQSSDNCQEMTISIYEENTPSPVTITVNCDLGQYTIPNLSQGTSYTIYCQSNCGINLSEVSCPISFKTSCKQTNILTNFDQITKCIDGCNHHCYFDGIWQNTDEDDTDWIVWSGETSTVNTGPSSDFSGIGKYIYLESTPAICGEKVQAILQSSCLLADDPNGFCDLSFYYHMYGTDIGILTFDISLDNGENWTNLWTKNGDQGNKWIKDFIDIEAYQNKPFLLRMTGTTDKGDKGDIAIDQIELISARSITPYTFYADVDQDGFGNDQEIVQSCSFDAPIGYSKTGGDCDDHNPNIKPTAIEIPCNLIDENCDGVLDLTDLQQPLSIVSTVVLAESCEGKKDGTVSVNVTGGLPPYTYHWNDNPGSLSSSLNNIGAGIYRCTIVDKNGCGVVSDFLEVKALAKINIFVENLQKAHCLGIDDGAISIAHTGGQGPFEYLWSNGATSPNLTSLPIGDYQITVTDSKGCQNVSAKITVSPEVLLSNGITLKKQPSCYGLSNGKLEIKTSGGVSPYNYQWMDGNVGNIRNNIKAGIYKATVTDAEGCMALFETELLQPDSFYLDISNIENVQCYNQSNGEIKLLPHGGKTPITYTWSDISGGSNPRKNLIADLYTVYAFDNNGCQASLQNIEVSQPPPLSIFVDTVYNTTCKLTLDGRIITHTAGGIAPYSHKWTNTDQNTSFADNLSAGTYNITTIDQNNCKVTVENIKVGFDNKSFSSELIILNDNVCPEQYNGKIAVKISNSFPPFDYNWSAGIQHFSDVSGDTISQLGAGMYSVTTTDSKGCVSISSEVTLQKFEPIRFQTTVVPNECLGDSTATLTITGSGGTAPINYYWNDGFIGAIRENMGNGLYWCTLVDANNCVEMTSSLEITSISSMAADILTHSNIIGQQVGQIGIQPKNGVSPYEIIWQNPMLNGFFVSQLKEGSYAFTLTDALGCTFDSIAIVDLVSSNNEVESAYYVFPNPANEKLFISSNAPIHGLNFRIMSVLGQSVKHGKLETNFVDISTIPVGRYFIEIRSASQVWTATFVKI